MNNFEIHDAATDLAAGRTAYSLAREVLGLRAQVDELRQEREENIGTLAAQDAILGIIANRLGVPAAPLRKPQGEKLIEALSRQGEERAQLRKTLACMEAKEGEELTDLYQQVNDLGAVLEYVGQALGEPLEPLHTFDERVRVAAEGVKAERDELRAQSEAIGQLCPTDYENQDGLLCALLKIRRGEFDRTKAVRIEGYQPQASTKALAKPPAAK